jgi:hypothetical protein
MHNSIGGKQKKGFQRCRQLSDFSAKNKPRPAPPMPNDDVGKVLFFPSNWNINNSKINSIGIEFVSPDKTGYVQVYKNIIPNANLANEVSYTVYGLETLGFRLTELNNNTYFLSGHPAVRVTGIASYGESKGIPPHDVEMMMSPIH